MATSTDVMGFSFSGDTYHPGHIKENSTDKEGNHPQPIFRDQLEGNEICAKCHKGFNANEHWFFQKH